MGSDMMLVPTVKIQNSSRHKTTAASVCITIRLPGRYRVRKVPATWPLASITRFREKYPEMELTLKTSAKDRADSTIPSLQLGDKRFAHHLRK